MTDAVASRLRWSQVAALWAAPLLTVPFLAEQRELPRHALIDLCAFAALAVALAAGELRVGRRWLTAAGLFSLVLVAATAAATSPWRSFWGPYEGHAGALAWLALLALAATAPPLERVRPMMVAAVALGVFQAALGLYQHLQTEAPRGTMGHAMFLAILLAFTLVLTVGAGASLDDVRRRRMFVAGSALISLTLGLTARRGPLLAASLGLAALTLLVPLRRRLVPFLLAAGLAVAVAAVWSRPGSSEYLLARVTSAPPPHAEDSIQERLDYVRVALPAIAQHPLLGHGFGSFRDLYAREKSSSVARFETLVHDLPLELLLSTGALGLIAFVWLLVCWVGATRRALSVDRWTAATLTAACGAWLVCLLFNFDQPSTSAWVWFLGGALLTSGASEVSLPAAGRWAGVAAAAGAAALALWPLLADERMGRGAELERAGDLAGATSAYRSAVDLAPYESLYRLKLMTALRAESAQSTGAERAVLAHAGLSLEPDNPFLHEHLGIALQEQGRLDDAQASLTEAATLAPTFADFQDALGQLLAQRGQMDQALDAVNQAIALDDRTAAYLNDRGNVLLMLGRKDDATADYRRALALDPSNALASYNLNRLGQAPHP